MLLRQIGEDIVLPVHDTMGDACGLKGFILAAREKR
jgi:hypothetical protein